MAKYIKQEMADLRGDGMQRSFYRMKVERNIGTEELIRHMTHPGSGLSTASAIHVIEALGEQLARELAEGYSVTIDGIGTFTASLGLDRKHRREEQEAEGKAHNARCLTVTGVRYKADKRLVRDVALDCELRKAGESRPRQSAYSRDERLSMAVEYLTDAAHPVMRLADYVRLTGLSRSGASRELREFLRGQDAQIESLGRGPSLVYVLKRQAETVE